MTEQDLGLKVGTRRLLWQLGFSTRLDVELRGSRPAHQTPEAANSRRVAPAESFTDLDVLGVLVTPSLRVQTTIADCKTGRRDRPTARMFWARGAADLFAADEVMLVRDREVNDATRQLSHRLGITVVAAADLQTLQQLHGVDQITTGAPSDVLFDRETVSRHLRAFTELDHRLDDLLEYRNFDYWVYDQHRNLIQLVAHLRAASSRLDPTHPVHLALLLDLAWLYTLSTAHAAARVRAAHLADPDRGLQEYMFGGPVTLQERRRMAEALRDLAPRPEDAPSYLPSYYRGLRELVTRQLRRPDRLQIALRHAELASALTAARTPLPLPLAMGSDFDPVGAKLLADVCGFLVSAARLNPDFRPRVRAAILDEPIPSSNTARTPRIASLDTDPSTRPGAGAGAGELDAPEVGPPPLLIITRPQDSEG